MSMPLFRAAIDAPPVETYDDPGAQYVDDTGYEPGTVTADELARIKEEMRLNRVQITPENVRHAIEAEEIRRVLRNFGIRSVRKVSSTRDTAGLVKLTFTEFRRLIEQAGIEARKTATEDNDA